MCRSAKLSMWFVLLLIVALTACAPAATPIPPTATNPPPTDTPVPPTATSTLAPTNLPALRLRLPKTTFQTSCLYQHPRSDDKVDVNGNKMWVECYGKGSPTIILEHGYRAMRSAWNSIIPQLRR